VTKKRLKMLTSLDQNGKQPVNPLLFGITRTKALPADGRVLIRELVVYAELGKPLFSPVMQGKPTAREAEGGEGMRLRKKRTLPCNGEDRDWNIILL
jgi:hypothetical protein